MEPKFKWYMVPILLISVTACDPVVEKTNSNNNAQTIKVVDESAANKPTENEASTRMSYAEKTVEPNLVN